LSTRFVEPVSARGALRAALVATTAVLVAACGASAPKQAAGPAPAVVAPAAALGPGVERAAAPAVTAPAAPKDDAGRRGARRDERRAAEAAEVDSAAVALAPIPEAAQQGYDRALAALHGQDWLRAELELEQLAQSYPAYPGPQVNLAIVYLHDGRREDARAALDRALAIDPNNAAANNQLGIVLRNEGKFDEAERAYRRALATNPTYALAHYNLGVLLDVYLRRGAEAIEHYEAYQSSLSEPDKTVAGWLIDLRRRVGSGASNSQVAKEDGA
jgi:lipoprotein NlpI